MVLSKCVKFQSNSFDSLGEKRNYNIYHNIGIKSFLSPKGGIILAKFNPELWYLVPMVPLWLTKCVKFQSHSVESLGEKKRTITFILTFQ